MRSAHAAPKCRRVFHRVRTNRCVNLLAFYPSFPCSSPLFPTVPCSDRVAALFRSKPRMGRWNIFSLLEVEERRRDISANSSSTRFPFTLRFRIMSTDNNRRGLTLDDDARPFPGENFSFGFSALSKCSFGNRIFRYYRNSLPKYSVSHWEIHFDFQRFGFLSLEKIHDGVV